MKYLVIAKPGMTPIPPEHGADLLKATNDWLEATSRLMTGATTTGAGPPWPSAAVGPHARATVTDATKLAARRRPDRVR